MKTRSQPAAKLIKPVFASGGGKKDVVMNDKDAMADAPGTSQSQPPALSASDESSFESTLSYLPLR